MQWLTHIVLVQLVLNSLPFTTADWSILTKCGSPKLCCRRLPTLVMMNNSVCPPKKSYKGLKRICLGYIQAHVSSLGLGVECEACTSEKPRPKAQPSAEPWQPHL